MKAELGKHSAVRESQVNSKGDQRVTRLGLAGGAATCTFQDDSRNGWHKGVTRDVQGVVEESDMWFWHGVARAQAPLQGSNCTSPRSPVFSL